MKIKTTKRFHFKSRGMDIRKKIDNTSVDNDKEKWKHSYIAGGNVKEIVNSSVKLEFNIWFVNSSLCGLSKMMKACSHKDVYVNVSSSINHNSPKLETIQMSIS